MDLNDQLKLEDDLILHGAERYEKTITDAQEGNRGSETGYSRRLVQNLINPVSTGIAEFCTDGARKHGKFKKILKNIDSQKLAYIGLKTVMDTLHLSIGVNKLCIDIGTRIEDDMRFSAFKEYNPEYFNSLMKDFNKKNTKAYRHMRNVLAVTSAKKGFKWETWTTEIRMGVGSIILDRILLCTDIVERVYKRDSKNNNVYVIKPTLSAIQWIEGYNNYASLLHPYTKPCVIPPDDWSGIRNGGYWSEAMRHRNPMIKGLSQSEESFVSNHDLGDVYKAVNSIQSTPWSINTDVLEIMQYVWQRNLGIGLPKKEPIDIPKFRVDTKPKDMDPATLDEFMKWKGEVSQLYTDEVSRAGRAYEAARVIAMAKEYSNYESIYFVHQCDFRGRLYASSSGINPQGADFNKALLRFSKGVPLGDNGLYWLSVHGANCYGVDKVSFDERVDWINANTEAIQLAGHDPLDYIDFWSEADKPWQFLAFCIEFAQAIRVGDGFISYLPVGMDGSCNGLQNFSAMLRDEVGGEATNLVPGEAPRDIYQMVADVTRDKVLSDTSQEAARGCWKSFIEFHGGIPRAICKRPVMTLPYGCTKFSCFSFVHDAMKDLEHDIPDLNNAVAYLTEHLWEAIGEVVVSAKVAMAWLQGMSDKMSAKNLPIWWVNPIGFPVYQNNVKTTRKRVRTLLLGDSFLSLNKKTNKVSRAKQAQGIAPNFVHSMDSAHMMFTVLLAQQDGIDNFAMIHDDFGTHAGNVENFRVCIREAFVRMYRDHEPLHDLYVSCALALDSGDLPPVPDYGELDILNVLDSEYFFG